MTLTSHSDAEAVARAASRSSGCAVQCTGFAAFNDDMSAGRFRLDNGLTIIFMADGRAPVFAYQSWFRVGSKHEDPQRTGLAHLFEHLMFKGTKKHAPGEFDADMERRGTQTNAATWVDWTYYTQALAAREDNLEAVVHYEVDRMAGLVLDEETFASELEVVKNERRMSVDDSIAGTLSLRLFDLAYTQHPYRWPTIGSMDHLQAATLDDLRGFYRTFYAPNNATIVVVGDLEPVGTLSLLARSYSSIPSQTLPTAVATPEPRQHGSRCAHLNRQVVVPQMTVGFHAASDGDPDYSVTELLSEILLAGDNGRLYRRLVSEEGLVAEIEGGILPFAEPTLFELAITGRPEADPQQILDVLQQELDRLAKGPTQAEREKALHGLELDLLESLRTAESVAEGLGHCETNRRDFSMTFSRLEHWRRVQPTELRRVAGEVFRANNRSAVIAAVGGEVAP